MFKRNRKAPRYNYQILSFGYVNVTSETTDRYDAIEFFGDLCANRPDATHVLYEVDTKTGKRTEIVRSADVHPTNR